MNEKRIGLIVNPIAGMGGRVGLKGTDGAEALSRARELGATPQSAARAQIALKQVLTHLEPGLVVHTPSGEMGEVVARRLGIAPLITGGMIPEATTSIDTQAAARALAASGIDLLLFAGGDGTARDVAEAIGTTIPALGIPTGVKMHSAVYATNPRTAGDAAARFLAASNPRTTEAEVMDIDEDAFRSGRVSARLFGMLRVPDIPQFVQHLKSGSASSDSRALLEIADDIIERMCDDALWILGPGTTTRAISDRLGLPKSLLGVDLVRRGAVIAADVTEQQLLGHLDGSPARIVVTPIGGQGFLFGRGNQQLSPGVIRAVGKTNIIVIATQEKIAGLRGEPLLVDTGDADLDAELSGFMRVVSGFHTETVYRVS
jgi:predicted polyphosphate/ATP-dependent NAD kinase